jgi:hypothetical protein
VKGRSVVRYFNQPKPKLILDGEYVSIAKYNKLEKRVRSLERDFQKLEKQAKNQKIEINEANSTLVDTIVPISTNTAIEVYVPPINIATPPPPPPLPMPFISKPVVIKTVHSKVTTTPNQRNNIIS